MRLSTVPTETVASRLMARFTITSSSQSLSSLCQLSAMASRGTRSEDGPEEPMASGSWRDLLGAGAASGSSLDDTRLEAHWRCVVARCEVMLSTVVLGLCGVEEVLTLPRNSSKVVRSRPPHVFVESKSPREVSKRRLGEVERIVESCIRRGSWSGPGMGNVGVELARLGDAWCQSASSKGSGVLVRGVAKADCSAVAVFSVAGFGVKFPCLEASNSRSSGADAGSAAAGGISLPCKGEVDVAAALLRD